MTGGPKARSDNWRTLLASRRAPGVLLGAAVVVVGASVLLAFGTIHPPPLPVRPAKIANIKLVPPEEPPPPTSADIATAEPSSAPPPATASADGAAPTKPLEPADWTTLPIDELRSRANAQQMPAMEEMARRLIQGAGMTRDPQAGAGWLVRAAELGSPQAAFNVGVMYEQGFVVERNSTRAGEWYRKAADGNLPAAKHNLALLLRDGKGTARNGEEAIALLRSSARQGMAASMFSLGDIYERGDAAPKDLSSALAWFAIAAEFEQQVNRGAETKLGRTAQQRAQTLQRLLTPAELERAQEIGQKEFHAIVAALTPPKPAAPVEPEARPAAAEPAPAPPPVDDAAAWPRTAADQVRVIQQALIDLRRLRDKPDGVLGPATRNAIRDFQRSTGLRETGEANKDVYVALRRAVLAERDVVATSPLPAPPKAVESAKPEPPQVELPKPDLPRPDWPKAAPPQSTAATPAKADPPKSELTKPAPPQAASVAPAKPELPQPQPEPPQTAATTPAKAQPPIAIDLGKPEPAPPPPTSADIARAPQVKPAKVDPEKPAAPPIDPSLPPAVRVDTAKPLMSDAWPAATGDQVRAIQTLLHDLKILRAEPTGQVGPATRTAIREYERMSGLKETGEPSKALFDSLKEMRGLMAPKPATGSN